MRWTFRICIAPPANHVVMGGPASDPESVILTILTGRNAAEDIGHSGMSGLLVLQGPGDEAHR